MTLDQYREYAERALDPFVRWSVRIGLTPDGISAVAFLLAVAAGGCYVLAADARALYLAGALLVLGNGALDLLDGAVARETDTASAAGDLLDHVLDRYADIALLVGLAAGASRWALGFAAVTGVLMTSYLGTQAQAVGLDRVYGGAVGRADRLAIVGAVTGLLGLAALVGAGPIAVGGVGAVTLLLGFFAVVGHLTAIQRFYGAVRALRDGGRDG
ncbi:MAG: CDP-alcohol phosphatidyltransferase family protein [Haloarculaceae archaeon]